MVSPESSKNEEGGDELYVSSEAVTVCPMSDPKSVSEAITICPMADPKSDMDSQEGESNSSRSGVEAAKLCHMQSYDTSKASLEEMEIKEGLSTNSVAQQEEIVTISQLRPSRLYKFDLRVQGTQQ